MLVFIYLFIIYLLKLKALIVSLNLWSGDCRGSPLILFMVLYIFKVLKLSEVFRVSFINIIN